MLHHLHFFCQTSHIGEKNSGNDKSPSEFEIMIDGKGSNSQGLGKYDT